ncbi:magnesium/cobalt transporter CorA [Kineococcus gynurae]|uniref:Magnesium transport protein CorA n=1 Tax=Kineococcus gynurae TaxID=452979 RepID=A0ABV5LQU4_9ACTN
MIVDVAHYIDGERREVSDLDAALTACLPGDGDFVWIGMKDPTRAEFDEVAGDLRLHRLAVEDAVVGHQRPKVERYGDSVFVVLKVLEYDDATSAVETGEIMLFVGPHFVVTVRRGEVGSLRGVRRELEGDAGRGRLRRGPRAVLHAVMDHVVDGYVAIDAELEQDVEEMEEQVFSPARTSDAQRIYSLKREVLEVRRAAAPLVDPLRELVNRDGSDPDDHALFVLRDVLDHLVRTVEHVEGYDRLLTDILSAHLAQVSVQQNDDMRRISAWAAMFALPTLIAGVYGMNFDNMPELKWHYGYFACLALMVTACSLLYRAFKRSGWL